jgi:hypothetical protein
MDVRGAGPWACRLTRWPVRVAGVDDEFAGFVRSALARAGMEFDETDIAVIRVADAVYGPDREALMAADLSAAPVEHDCDPSRPPSGTGREVTR